MAIDENRARQFLMDVVSVSELIKALDTLVHDYEITVTAHQYALVEEDSHGVARHSIRVAEWLAVAAVLTNDIVDELEKRVKKIGDEIKDRYKERGIPIHELARANDIARRDVCALLHEIRKNNGGRLPSHLDDDWKNLQCSTYRFR